MNKKLLSFVFLIITLSFLVGCGHNLQSTLSIESSLYNNQEIVDDFINSDSKFAVKVTQEENQWIQNIYIWNNALRRDLRNDLIQITNHVDGNSKKIVSFEFGEKIIINNKDIKFNAISDLSKEVIDIMFPNKFNMSLNEFYNHLAYLIIRLETLEKHGDTEVIDIEIKTTEKLVLSDLEKDKIYYSQELGFKFQ